MKKDTAFRPSELITSKLRLYSIGLVAENKALGSNDIEVVPIEESPMLDGEISAYKQDYETRAVDYLGKAYAAKVETRLTIKATWLKGESTNRMTSPDVRKGEHVRIYQYADADAYYWTTHRSDNDLRKLETVVFAISATRVEPAKTTYENSYSFEASSHKKRIRIHTSKADGEPFEYTILIDTGNGKVVVEDDIGNSISLDSANKKILLKNADSSKVDIDKDVVSIVTATTVNITTSTLNIIANTNLDGNLAVSGSISAEGNIVSGENISAAGNIAAGGAVSGIDNLS